MGRIGKSLSDYAQNGTLRLHMPGHKGTINPLDNTEIPQTGDINNPIGPYREALGFLKDAYRSHRSFLVTGGATLAIQAMVLFAKKLGYKIVAMRSLHMSVINACLAFDASFQILDPEYDEIIAAFSSPESVFLRYLEHAKEKCALIITSPDYYGRCADIQKIKRAAQKKGALVFCDEAHGAHFNFSKLLPESAGKYADIWVHGAHKTLGALTQGAFAHCSDNIDADLFGRILGALNTSSPSHVIAASLEDAVIGSQGGAWDRRVQECSDLEEKINSLNFIKCAGKKWAESAGYFNKDVTRVVIDAKDAGGGLYIFKKLYEDSNIQLESADFRYAVAIMTIYDKEGTDSLLYDALRKQDKKKEPETQPELPAYGKKAAEAKAAWLNISGYVKLGQAEGKVSAAILGAYPPGTALVLPGEIIEAGHIKYFTDIIKSGGSLFGMQDGLIAVSDM